MRSDSSISKRGGLDDLAVDDELVTLDEFDDVVGDDLGPGQLAGDSVPSDPGLGLADDREIVERALGAQLLDDADPAVGDDEQAECAVDE
ncbi:MAG: hypothetical protein V9F04_06700 [Dermatophilaceae bacterium]